jgi:hypothetical protein
VLKISSSLAISMVIHTEYRSQRYSMGSSDPLPTGFEIRFGSLNFQPTGNDYLMHITNRDELHPWRATRPGPISATSATDVPAPAQEDAVGTPATRRRRRSGQRSRQARMERHRSARTVARGDAPTDGTTTPTGERAAVGLQFPYGMRNAAAMYASSTSTDVAAYDDLPGHHLLVVPNLIATTNDESYHG